MPRNFEFPLAPGHVDGSELWVPLRLQPEEFLAGHAAEWNFRMVGRLKPGITPEQAQSDAERVAQATVRAYPASCAASIFMQPPNRYTRTRSIKPVLLCAPYSLPWSSSL
jgi:hypothetical protein